MRVAGISIDGESPAKKRLKGIWKSKSSDPLEKPDNRQQNLKPGRRSGKYNTRPSSSN